MVGSTDSLIDLFKGCVRLSVMGSDIGFIYKHTNSQYMQRQ